jgi:hypothetical protein
MGGCLVRDRADGPRGAHINPCFELFRGRTSHPALAFFTTFIFFFALAFGRVILFPIWSWWWSLLFASLSALAVYTVSFVLKKTKSDIMPRSDYTREWNRIDPYRRQCWETLGLDAEKWNKRKGRPDPTGNSRWFKVPWNELPSEQREAAAALGFDWKAWTVNATSGMGAVGAEDDALLDLPGHFRGIHFSGGTRYPTERGQPWLIVIVSAELTAALWAIFSIVSMIFLVRYHYTPKILVFTTLISIGVALVASGVLPGRRFSLGWDVKGRWLLRLVCLFAGLGAVAGFSLSSDNMRDYWPYYTMRHYTNVAPDEPAAAHLDAAVIVFMEGARPDVNRAIGYHRQGTTYCTAPISYDSMHGSADGVVSSDIQYWAIGLNCCHDTQGFSCGDSLQSTARSGIVAIKQGTRAQSFFQGNLLADNSYYEEAIKMNMAKFDLTSPEDYIMVRWVGDIDEAVGEIFKDALRSWFLYEGYGFLFALFVGLMMPLVIFRDEFEVHANATKAKFFKALNYPTADMLEAFND